MDALAERLARVDEEIAGAAHRAGRDASEITRIVVTKFHPASLVERLHALGVHDIGENRQQELSHKIGEVGALPGLRWHFIGQAQTNKARALRAAASTVSLIVHCVDRAKLADALESAPMPKASPLEVLVQVNLTDDPGRGGVMPEGVEALAAHVEACATLTLRGVMAVAPLGEAPAAAFARLRACADRVVSVAPQATWISAGMSADFAEAIAAGATHLRIGTAITGPRPADG